MRLVAARTTGRVRSTTSARRLSESTTPRRTVLDSDVIFARVLHDLFGRLAIGERLFTLVWSDELLAEARSALIRRKGVSPEVADRWVGHLSSSFPNERVDLAAHAPVPELSTTTADPDDQHV
jgi:PIN domain